jgi:two-component system, cell cycle response regulator
LYYDQQATLNDMQTNQKIMKLLSTKQIIIRIAAIIASSEFMIMLVLTFIPFELSKYTEAMLDVALLATISTPFIYIWVINPYVEARDDALNQVSQLAFTDPLTQLANRRQLLQHLERLSASCIRHKIYGALLLIDLDGFKLVNDEYGHDAGDAVLIEIAIRLISSIRSDDIACRLGGDEFVILVDHLDSDHKKAQTQAMHIANKIINLANIPVEFKNAPLEIGASIGICLLGFEQHESEAMLRKADVAMYRAKKMGKGRAAFTE